eukprot:g3422.t1
MVKRKKVERERRTPTKYLFFRCNDCRLSKKKCKIENGIFNECNSCITRKIKCCNTWFKDRIANHSPVRTKLAKVDVAALDLLPAPCAVLVYQRDYHDEAYRHNWHVFKQNAEAEKQSCEVYMDFDEMFSLPDGSSLHSFFKKAFDPTEHQVYTARAKITPKDGRPAYIGQISCRRLSESEKHEYITVSWTTDNGVLNFEAESSSSSSNTNDSFDSSDIRSSTANLHNNKPCIRSEIFFRSLNFAMRSLMYHLRRRCGFSIDIERFVKANFANSTYALVFDACEKLDQTLVYATPAHLAQFGDSLDYSKLSFESSVVADAFFDVCSSGSNHSIPKLEFTYGNVKYTLNSVRISNSQSDEVCLIGFSYESFDRTDLKKPVASYLLDELDV